MKLGNVSGLTQHDSCPRKKREREEDGVGVGKRYILRNLADATMRPGKSEDWEFLGRVDVAVSRPNSAGWTSRPGTQAGFLGRSLEAESLLRESSIFALEIFH